MTVTLPRAQMGWRCAAAPAAFVMPLCASQIPASVPLTITYAVILNEVKDLRILGPPRNPGRIHRSFAMLRMTH